MIIFKSHFGKLSGYDEILSTCIHEVDEYFYLKFQKVKMEAPSATAASVNPPFLKPTVSQALAAPIHRKARILTRDPLREVEEDSMELQVEDDVRRLVYLKDGLVFNLLKTFLSRKQKNHHCG